MKIICKDNYDRETRSERLVAENIANHKEAVFLCNALRDDPLCSDDDYYVVVADDYKLYKFEP